MGFITKNDDWKHRIVVVHSMLFFPVQYYDNKSISIGDTAYSKKWVLRVLLHMMEDEKSNDDDGGGGGSRDDGVCDKIGGDNDEEETDGSGPDTRRKDDSNQMKPDLEEELCELWDMTMDSVGRL